MSIEAMKMALEALEWTVEQGGGPSCEHEAGTCFCKENNAINALRTAIQQAEAQQPSSKEHLFELWWEAHMPNATQEQAWTAFTAAVASNGVGIAAQQLAKGEPVAPYTVIKDTSDSPLSKRISKLIEMVFHYGKQNLSGVDDEISAISREIAKLESRVNRPSPSAPAAVVRDAISTVREHYRGTDWGKAAESICDAIDAAMLAAKEPSA